MLNITELSSLHPRRRIFHLLKVDEVNIHSLYFLGIFRIQPTVSDEAIRETS